MRVEQHDRHRGVLHEHMMKAGVGMLRGVVRRMLEVEMWHCVHGWMASWKSEAVSEERSEGVEASDGEEGEGEGEGSVGSLDSLDMLMAGDEEGGSVLEELSSAQGLMRKAAVAE